VCTRFVSGEEKNRCGVVVAAIEKGSRGDVATRSLVFLLPSYPFRAGFGQAFVWYVGPTLNI
jgi:hypothetical protein